MNRVSTKQSAINFGAESRLGTVSVAQRENRKS